MTLRALAFAVAVRRRYVNVRALRRPIGLVLRRVLATKVSRPTTVRLSTAFVDARRLAFASTIVRRMEQRVERIHHSSHIERTRHTDIVQRLLERTLRVERLPRAAPPARVPSRSRAVPAPTPRLGRPASPTTPPSRPATIVLRKTVVEQHRVPQPERAPLTRPPGEPEPTAPMHAAPIPVGEVDVHRLADQVLDVIDSRIVAQRERYGRL